MNSEDVPNKAGRIRRHTQGLVQEVRTWLELQMELAIAQVWERLDHRLSEVAAGSGVLLFGAIAIVFALAAGAMWLGPVLGHMSWGFLIMGGLAGVTAGIIHVVRTFSKPESGLPATDVHSDISTS
ncbi:MAG: phage holin family protein [Bacteroidota bacterium]|nr:phage holin family protein [Bacteroidota bacterium]MDE2834617.1 phage holin family protein [Bacteroidota bacterium]MDE2957728.1 phage holin family protein [Bacteroidota bacterium]